jgi:hypothetical protein
MSYQLVICSHDGTLKQIAESAGLSYEKGNGFYELTKSETISSKKQLVLFINGNYSTDSVSDIRSICGLPSSGDLNLSKGDLPSGFQLFIQSTAPNRKILQDGAAVFFDRLGVVPPSTSGVLPAPPPVTPPVIQYAIKYDAFVSSDSLREYLEEDDVSSLFNLPAGVDWSECDQPVPMDHQLPSLWYLSQLTRAQWADSLGIQITTIPHLSNERITRVSATGYLSPSSLTPLPVRLEYYWTEDWSCYAVSVGMEWGALIGSFGGHPLVLTPQFNYGNSDGSSQELPPLAVCECAEKAAASSSGGTGGGLSNYELRVTNEQRMDSICGHLLRVFSTHCADEEH